MEEKLYLNDNTSGFMNFDRPSLLQDGLVCGGESVSDTIYIKKSNGHYSKPFSCRELTDKMVVYEKIDLHTMVGIKNPHLNLIHYFSTIEFIGVALFLTIFSFFAAILLLYKPKGD
jgi:hypothetical protein